jgi:hypothetical protein
MDAMFAKMQKLRWMPGKKSGHGGRVRFMNSSASA